MLAAQVCAKAGFLILFYDKLFWICAMPNPFGFCNLLAIH
jgi:hypothetical protein